eukprot:gene1005-1132_t
MSRALVIGGTGATGKELIRQLIASNKISHITSIVRRRDETIADGSYEAFRHIDFGYSTRFSRLAREANVPALHIMTSSGADPKSWFSYMKMKGEIEEEVKRYQFQSLSIYRPGWVFIDFKAVNIGNGAKRLYVAYPLMPQ